MSREQSVADALEAEAEVKVEMKNKKNYIYI